MNNGKDSLNTIHKVNELIDAGDYDTALKQTEEIPDDENAKFTKGALYIDVGTLKKDISLVRKGITFLDKFHLQKFEKPNKLRDAMTFYNIGNGYFSLCSLAKNNSSSHTCFQKTDLAKVKECYLCALECDKLPKKIKASVLTNLGNCYKQFGCVIESFEYYEKALLLNPESPELEIGIANALLSLSRIAGERQIHFLRDALQHFQLAAKTAKEKHLIEHIETNIDNISKFFEKNKISPHIRKTKEQNKSEDSDDLKGFLKEFCLEHDLYLNACLHCRKCNGALGDPAAIRKMIISIKDVKDESQDPFLILSGYLNHIKQDYITARFLLVLSRYKKMGFECADKNVRIIDTLEYNIHNIYIELAKTAFKESYNILDKIACFINQYLKVGLNEKDVSFSRIWYKDNADKENEIVRDEIVKTGNYQLNALYEIHKEIKDGKYQKLKRMRHSLTHRFLNVNMFGNEKEDKLSEEMLVERTIELLRLVRNAVMYLLFFVDIEERKKEQKAGKLFGNIARDMPDEWKYL
jgi:tetratricopeptide (TPR) repeat protein